jgi:hypothetical protein
MSKLTITPKKGTHTFICKVYPHDDEYDPCRFAQVVLTPKISEEIVNLHTDFVEFKQNYKNLDIYKLQCWDYLPYWIEGDDYTSTQESLYKPSHVNEVLDESLNDEEMLEIQPLPLDDISLMRSESCRIELTERYVSWSCYCKHTSVKISTVEFPIGMLKEIANKLSN